MPDPILKTLQQTTAAGTPNWLQNGVGPIGTATAPEPGGNAQNSLGTIAYVNPSSPHPNINVVRPNLYTPAVAAHEATHNWQNSRNQDFVDNIRATAPKIASMRDYDYGGVSGLKANPLKSIGDYNPEQQASMVGDLTAAQSRLKPGMSAPQLQAFDNTKNALERPIQQLKDIPPADNSFLGRIDSHLQGHPISYLKTFLSPSMPSAPQAVPSAPSAALGYPNLSKLVR